MSETDAITTVTTVVSTPSGRAGTGVLTPLATPTDLSPDGVREIAEATNPLVADAIALWLKTKNFHWHLSGRRFRDLHLLFDEQAAALLASVDLLAERVRRIGGTTVRSVGHVADLKSVGDDDEELVPAEEMVRRLMIDNKRMAEDQRAAHGVCDRLGDVATASLLETLIDETERRVWFLYEIAQDDPPVG